jgi:hypothetical protein
MKILISKASNCIVGLLASSAIDYRFQPRFGQTKDFKIGICCFSSKSPVLRSKSKDWWAWNRDSGFLHNITEILLKVALNT